MPENKLGFRALAYILPELAEHVGNWTGEIILAGDKPWNRRLQQAAHLGYLSRRDAERGTKPPSFGNRVAHTLFEMIPGVGDLKTFLEIGFGVELPGGRRLDWVERGVSAFGLIPIVPATPFRAVTNAYRRGVENTVEKSINPHNFGS